MKIDKLIDKTGPTFKKQKFLKDKIMKAQLSFNNNGKVEFLCMPLKQTNTNSSFPSILRKMMNLGED